MRNGLLMVIVAVLVGCGSVETPVGSEPLMGRHAVDALLSQVTRDPAYHEPVPEWWDAQVALSSNAWWIGLPDNKDPKSVTFKKTFSLKNVPDTATLTVASDGAYTVHLNGHTVGGWDGEWRYARQFAVAQWLRSGANELIVKSERKEGKIETLAMLFAPPDNGFVSDDTWRAAQGEEDNWVPVSKVHQHGIGNERGHLLGWNVQYKNVYPVAVEGHPSETVKSALRVLDADGRSAVFPHGEGKKPTRIVVDFGRTVLGFVHIVGHVKGEVPKGAKFKIASGEFYKEAKSTQRHRWNKRLTYDLPGGTFNWRQPLRRGFRYVCLDFPALDSELTIDAIYVEYPYYPVRYNGYFACSDPLLNRIWGLSAYSVRICMQSVYEDGIKRDTWAWMGDARVEALCNYPVFADNHLYRFTMDNLRGRGEVTQHINRIPAYSIYWILGLHDDWWQTGSLDYVRKRADELEGMLDFCLAELDDNHLYNPPSKWWRFMDWTKKRNRYDLVDLDEAGDLDKKLRWTEEYIDYRGAMTAQHAILYEAVIRGSNLLRQCGREESARKYEAIATKMKSAANRLLWDPARGAYADGLFEGKLSPMVTRQTNAVAVLSGMAPQSRHAAILKNVFHNDDVPQLQTFYFSFYTLDAWYRLGNAAGVLDRVRKYWGSLVMRDATTLWERYDPERQMPFGELIYTNMSHAWGAAPMVLFPQQILGIQQTGPGWSLIRLTPKMHDLKWAQGVVPTPHGNITIWLSNSGPGIPLTGRIRLPKSIRLELTENSKGVIIERYKTR